ncbi:MAG: peptide chain release factor N(5)-glutamine methyltransferase, partial [Desulfovibrio sp.]
LMLAMPSPVADDAAAAIRALTTRRCAGEPLAHITGRREFFGRDFEVSPQTLIPRPETELLLEIVLRECEGHGEVRFADLGTGTGCIGITLALELPHSRGLLLEYSAGALPVAARNISSLQAADRLALVRGDMFTPPLLPQGLDVLVSNPPYIAAAEEDEVMAEVLHHEPHSALFSEQDGLRHLHAVIRSGQQALKPGGLIAMEHGYRQGEAVRRLLMEAGYGAPRTEQDLAGLDRCTWARRD